MELRVVLRQAKTSYDRPYSYLWTQGVPAPLPGQRVLVPFGRQNRPQEAFVWFPPRAESEAVDQTELKDVLAVYEDFPVLSRAQMRLVELMRLRYACTYGEAIRLMLPPGLSARITRRYQAQFAAEDRDEILQRYPRYRGLADFLQQLLATARGLSEEQIRRDCPVSKACLQTLEEAGLLSYSYSCQAGIQEKTERYAYLPQPERCEELLSSQVLRSAAQARVLELLLEYGDMGLTTLEQNAQVSRAVLRGLEKKGLIAFAERSSRLGEAQLQQILRDLGITEEMERGGGGEPEQKPEAKAEAEVEAEPEPEPIPELTPEQAQVYRQLLLGLEAPPGGGLREYLLHGVTGSGKTELYLRVVQTVLERGQTAIILVPEISLTPQMTQRVYRRFGRDIAIIHSQLSPRLRYEQWQRIRRQEVRIVLGPRSALFAPLDKLGLIVIDEEHDSAYRSDQSPVYDSRSIARLRARGEGALLLLGSATPSIETYSRAEIGKSKILELRQRATQQPLPQCHIVDMRRAANLFNPDEAILSPPLQRALQECFERGEQSMLFLNRRGYASAILCRDCGEQLGCPNCSVHLFPHKSSKYQQARVICHYCGYQAPEPQVCPNCGSSRIGSFGLGIQQLEDSLARLFPKQRVLRMDQDSIQIPGGHAAILERFRRGEAEILLGTQMIAKGHDFPRVSVLGIISCDQLMIRADFRAHDRAFQLMTQAAGRAGRHGRPGEVYLQTFQPESYSVQAAAQHDYLRFYKEELALRKLFSYPPYRSMLSISSQGPSPQRSLETLERIVGAIRQLQEVQEEMRELELSPIQEAYPFMLYHRYRHVLHLRSTELAKLSYLALISRQIDLPQGCHIRLSMDPA